MAFGLLSGLLGGKDGALKQVASVIDSIHTSEEEKLDKKIIMQRIQQKLAEKQLDVNSKEASHRSVFVAGWRPAIGWICGLALLYSTILAPILGIGVTVPRVDSSLLTSVLIGMLGLGAMRTVEKTKGVQRER